MTQLLSIINVQGNELIKEAIFNILFTIKLISKDKTLKLFENGYHEMQHDEECDELVETVKEWISKRADRAKPLGNKF